MNYWMHSPSAYLDALPSKESLDQMRDTFVSSPMLIALKQPMCNALIQPMSQQASPKRDGAGSSEAFLTALAVGG